MAKGREAAGEEGTDEQKPMAIVPRANGESGQTEVEEASKGQV